MSNFDPVAERGLPRILWVAAPLAVCAALAGELLRGAALPPVDIVVTMICLTVLRLLGAALPMTCTVPLATASTVILPGRSHRQEEEEP